MAYEELLSQAGVEAMKATPPRLGALSVRIEAGMPIPASWSQKKRHAALSGDLAPTGKPDFDNIAKAVGDSLNKIVWHDDSQIIVCAFRKFYSAEPGLTIKVWDWE
jgi:Holliday junction resolvase RusA-like endonuclease